jgi:hypothetical protein
MYVVPDLVLSQGDDDSFGIDGEEEEARRAVSKSALIYLSSLKNRSHESRPSASSR